MVNEKHQLVVNVFGLQLEQRKIFRHIVQLKLVDQKHNKDYILTTMSARGRGNRASKQNDNFILMNYILDTYVHESKESGNSIKRPIVAYDGAQTLFSLTQINVATVLENNDALELDGISEFLKDSLKFLNGRIELFCQPDVEKPIFDQTDIEEWSDPRFLNYLDIVTSQSAIRSGKYLSQSRGLYVNTEYEEPLRGNWGVGAKGVHKGCRIVGDEEPLPILELDPQSTQYFAPISLAQLLMNAIPNVFNRRHVNPDNRLKMKVRTLLKDLKCNPYYADIDKWATNTLIVHDIDYSSPLNPEFQKQFPELKFPHLPAAVCGAGPNKKRYPLEFLRVLPYQTIDRNVLVEFKMNPRAKDPMVRWNDMQIHYAQFNFDDPIISEFGIRVCNDPFDCLSQVEGDRVTAPQISYERQVNVDDAKRDWRAGDHRFQEPSNIDLLMVVLIVDEVQIMREARENTELVANRFVQRCQEKGMRVRDVAFRASPGRNADPENFLTGIFADLVQMKTSRSFMPFVLLVSDDVPNIHEWLKFEERMSDIPTQHILLSNVKKMAYNLKSRGNDGGYRGNNRGGMRGGRPGYDLTLDNIVMKANIKAGGCNYTSDIPKDIANWANVSTFVVGLDVAHPDRAATRDGQPSTVGLSCNSAENPYTFIGDFAYTTPRKEAIDDDILRSFVDKNIRHFAEIRGFPEKVIIFRDGVSFGEEDEAARETSVIEETIVNIAEQSGKRDYKPSVLSFVVKKRHHTRFYIRDGRQGSPANPLPDTAVGGMIAEFGKRQIFIQAYRPVQGTAKIPSFLIIRDDEGFSDEHITKLVCAVCSLHQIVNSPTSIPTPVYVAHELAKRGRTVILKAYRLKQGTVEETDYPGKWMELTLQLSYSSLDRLSKIRVV
ncbi:unnamed protein product [Caenorhabditis bovis]|uniref:Piwi domain-containing protein n=1 Tax=Caenorhabditis bovis TaxID=2654633 RepID=A0A8S1FCV0_9PELO|nr:unnamed protein product [Caenorhabditis bovis]